jgi:diguanylate cyclase (GGDEF)-like protein/PAS domain S-box-containing protein
VPLSCSWDEHKALLDARKPYRDFEYRRTLADGRLQYVAASGEPIFDAGGTFRGYRGVATEITDRKVAEARLQHTTRVNAILSDINRVIVRVRSPQELFDEVCRIAVDTGGLPFAWLCVLDQTQMRLRPAASAGRDEGFLATVGERFSVRDDAPKGHGLTARAFRSRQPLVVNDVAAEPVFSYKDVFAARGIQAVAALPLVIGARSAGVLTLHAAEAGFFDDHEMVLLREVAANIAFALEHMEKEEKVRRLTRVYAVLSGINTLIVRASSREELFAESCRIALEQGAFKMAWIGVVDRQAMKIVPVASSGAETQFLTLVKERFSLREDAPMGNTKCAQAVRLKKPLVSNQIGDDSNVLFAKERVERGIGSMAVLPLLVAGEAVGLLALYAQEPGFFDEEEMRLLVELAGDIAFAIDHIDKQERLSRLSEELRHFGAAMDATPDAIYLVDRASMGFIHLNDAACRMRSQTREELLALGPAGMLELSVEALERTYDELIAAGVPAKPLEMLRERKDGTRVWVEIRRHALLSGERWMIVTLVRDITERKRAEAEQKLADTRIRRLNRVYAVLSGINTLLVRVQDRDTLFREACQIAFEHGRFAMAWIGLVDPAAKTVLTAASAGMTPEFIAHLSRRFAQVENPLAGNSLIAQAIRGATTTFSNDLQNSPDFAFKADFSPYGARSLAVLPLRVGETVIGVLALFSEEVGFFDDEELKLLTELAGDIAFAVDHIEKRERLDYLAYYDALTGLANRALFLERVAQYTRNAAAGDHKLALLVINLERFKSINDTLGRAAGDALLKQVAQWLTTGAGDATQVARVGADLFAVVLPEVRRDGDLTRLLEKAVEVFVDHPFHLNDGAYRIAAKIGVAVFPNDGSDADSLFTNAEAALKKAKASGERYLFYNEKMTAAVAGKLTLENQLRQALERGEFVLHYQPKISRGGKLTGAEALIRWNDPLTGLVPPVRFISLLEETGLIHDVGRWALRESVAQHLRWRSAGLPPVRIAVNVSPLQLRNRNFIAEVQQAIGVDPLAARGLELEITESVIMEDVRKNIACLEAIRAVGVSIAIDDFGTGFSSLSYLSKLPIDTLKIDRSFVVGMTEGAQGMSLVTTIIALAHSLKLKVVAEGVETEEQASLLRLLACDELQGYLFSKPLPGADFEARFLAGAVSRLPASDAGSV